MVNIGMKRSHPLEIIVTGLAAHAGCIAACFGLSAATLGTSCSVPAQNGHPLTFVIGQLGLLCVAIIVGFIYFKLDSQVRRYQFMFLLLCGLFVPALVSLSTVSLQAVFLVQVSVLLFQRCRNGCCRAVSD